MTDGILLIDKPAGMSSFGVVARIRRVLSERASKKIKVGHTGTLDPFATGLMILVVGEECKNAGSYTKKDKVYDAVCELGRISTTGDPEGDITEWVSGDKSWEKKIPDIEIVKTALTKFTGPIMQRPPIFSAIKIDGKRAYKLAREGRVVEMPERQVTIYSLELIDYSWPSLRIRAHVSSGTYIRSLVADIGQELQVGAYCKELRRTRIGEYDITDAKPLGAYRITS